MRLSRGQIVFLLAAIGALLYVVLRGEVFLPTKLTVGYESHPPKGLTAYVDSGSGFNESETMRFYGSRFSPDKRGTAFWFGPPLRNLRLDPGYRPLTISLTSLCLDSVIRTTCWPAAELSRRLLPANDISSVVVEGGSLRITRDGQDPYLLFQGGFLDEYTGHARVRKWLAVPLAVLLPLLLVLIWTWARDALAGLWRRLASPSIHLTWWQGLGVFVLLTLLATGNWLQLEEPGFPLWLILPAVMLAVALVPDHAVRPRSLSAVFGGIRGDGPIAATVAVLAAVVPVFGLLLLSWNQEFPYVGDQHFHLEIDRATYYFVRGHLVEILAVLLSLLLCLLLGWVRLWLFGTTVFFVVWSYTEAVPQYFIRYPGAGRFIAAPFFHVAETFHWDSLLNAARLANAAGVLAWLLVLRPLIVKRWPDWSIAPVAAAMFFQTDVAYYFTSSYLEPWSLILLLLAVEHQIRYGSSANRTAAALLLVGFAAVVKEAAIFMLPLVWAAGRPWRHGARQVFESCTTAVAAAIPFLVYFLIRAEAGERPFRMVDPQQFITPEKLLETYYQFDFHFGPGGILLCVLLITLLVSNAIFGARGPSFSRAASSLMLLAGVLFYLAYNYLEATSLGYAGYTRYYLFPFALLCAGLVFLQWPLKLASSSALAVAATAAAIVLNGGVLTKYYANLHKNDAARNFTEHYDAPVFLPIRALADAAGGAGALAEGDRITINNPLRWGMPSVGLNYPDLRRRYKLTVEENVPCVCSAEKSVILQPFVFMGGLNTHLRLPETRRPRQQFPKQRFYRIWTEQHKKKPACLKSMGATCSSVFELREQSELIGILGVH